MRLPGTLLCYAGGLIVAPFLDLPPSLPLLLGIPILAALICRRQPIARAALALSLIGLGLLQYQLAIAPPQGADDIHRLVGRASLVIEGVIEQIDLRYPEAAACGVAVTGVRVDGQESARSGRLLLTIDQLDTPLAPGDRIRFAARLRQPATFGTPGEFDYARHLAQRGIFTTAFVRRTSDIARLPHQTGNPLFQTLQRWRQQVATEIIATVPPPVAPYILGLATGERGRLSPEQKQLLARGGITHLFAISGLHLGLIAALLYFALLQTMRNLPPLLLRLPPRRLLPYLVFPCVATYLVFTGGAISTWRALLGIALATLAMTLRRNVPPLRLLATAAFLMLLCDPLALFAPAFQLSFAGAAGILCITPRWKRVCQEWPVWLAYPASLLVVTLAATIATLPLVLLHFHLLAPAGLLLNLVAVPLVTLLAVPLCFGGILASLVLPPLAGLLFGLASDMIAALLQLTKTLLTLPGLDGRLLYLDQPELTALSLVALALLAPVSPRLRLTAVVAGLLLILLPAAGSWQPGQLEVIALSVGQGDAALVTTPSGKRILVDGGGFSHSDYDTGERLVAPALGALGIDRLDAVVLSHDHPDHRNGLLHILRHFPVGSFWSPTAADQLAPELHEILSARAIPVRTFADHWSVIETSTTGLIAAYRVPFTPTAINDRSLVLYFRNGDDGLLMTGDLEATGLNALNAELPPGPVTLLKIPHHGSRNSDPCSLVASLGPQAAYISAGQDNRFGLPDPGVVERLTATGLRLLRTDRDGSIDFVSSGSAWQIKPWHKGLFR